MFDLDAGKLVVIGVVALIVIGPKDLPRVMRQVGQAVAKLRRMASDFQSQFMEAMREAELDDIRKDMAALNDTAKLPSFNPLETVRRELTGAMADRPLMTRQPTEHPAMAGQVVDVPTLETSGWTEPEASTSPDASTTDPLAEPLLPFPPVDAASAPALHAVELPPPEPASDFAGPAPAAPAPAPGRDEADAEDERAAAARRIGGA